MCGWTKMLQLLNNVRTLQHIPGDQKGLLELAIQLRKGDFVIRLFVILQPDSSFDRYLT
jgi:hypothetical protein